MNLNINLFINENTSSVSQTVNTYDTIAVFKAVKYDEFQFLYNGKILSPALSFAFYHIPNNASLHAIKQIKKNTGNFILNSITLSKRIDDVLSTRVHWASHQRKIADKSNIIKNIPIPRLVNETAKISDLIRIKTENMPVIYRKILAHYQLFSESPSDSLNEVQTPTMLPQKRAMGPSRDILPSFE